MKYSVYYTIMATTNPFLTELQDPRVAEIKARIEDNNRLEQYMLKIDEAMLGNEPQTRKQMQRIKKEILTRRDKQTAIIKHLLAQVMESVIDS